MIRRFFYVVKEENNTVTGAVEYDRSEHKRPAMILAVEDAELNLPDEKIEAIDKNDADAGTCYINDGVEAETKDPNDHGFICQEDSRKQSYLLLFLFARAKKQ